MPFPDLFFTETAANKQHHEFTKHTNILDFSVISTPTTNACLEYKYDFRRASLLACSLACLLSAFPFSSLP